MTASRRPWKIHRVHPAAEKLSHALGVSAVVGQLLANRGLDAPEDARRWLEASWSELTPPSATPGAAEAGVLIADAVARGSRVCVYGDYDVDGTTGAAILSRTLERLGSRPTVYLPHRLEEGYGLNAAAVRNIAAAGHRLLVTVDCGIASAPEVLLARSLGLRVVVTDHHQPKETLPDADALVHPHLPGRRGAADNLCGSAVAWKVAGALLEAARGVARLEDGDREHLEECAILAAMGTVADVVPLTGENRLLVRRGLVRLAATEHPGLRALLAVAKLDGVVLAEDVGFKLGPRFNAAGRLGCAAHVVELLTARDPAQAAALADWLDYANRRRQRIERDILAEAVVQAQTQVDAGRAALVVSAASADPSGQWHPGVIGIVASRLVERFQRPALVVSFGTRTGLGYGSGRSTPRLALHEALAACGDRLVTHGGHSAAAGFKVAPAQYAAFREEFWHHADGTFGGVPPPQPLVMEAEMRLADVTVALVRDLARLEPHGAANARPLFFLRNLGVESVKVIGKDQTHLALTVSQPGGRSVRAVAFGMAERRGEFVGRIDLAAVPRVNEWQGRQSAELEVKDVRAGTGGA